MNFKKLSLFNCLKFDYLFNDFKKIYISYNPLKFKYILYILLLFLYLNIKEIFY